MKNIIINLILSTVITIALLIAYTDRVVQEVASYYDIYYNSASGWVCTTHNPSDAHPELRWDWQGLTFSTYIICHGKVDEYLNKQ